jgi:hypothetical protein
MNTGPHAGCAPLRVPVWTVAAERFATRALMA